MTFSINQEVFFIDEGNLKIAKVTGLEEDAVSISTTVEDLKVSPKELRTLEQINQLFKDLGGL